MVRPQPGLAFEASAKASDLTCPRRFALIAGLTAAAWLPAMGTLAADDKKADSKDSTSPDVALYCDPTLGPAMRQIATLFRAHAQASVAVLSAPPALMLAQIERQARDDVLITLGDVMDDAVHRGLVKPETRTDGWRNRLVLAGRTGEVSTFAGNDPGALNRALGNGRIAVTDPTVAATFAGAAILDQLGFAQVIAGQLVGTADTGDVAFLIRTGATRLGLLYLTDVRADPTLAVAATVEAPAALASYAAAVNREAKSPNAQAFLDFLRTSDAQEKLQAMGLETTT